MVFAQTIPELRRDFKRLLAWPDLSEEARLLLEENFPSLELTEAFLVKRRWLEREALPLQIAVVGPTQVGKSTVVNLMLGKPLASVSPLAGWTVHACAFLEGVQEAPWLEALFSDYELIPGHELSRQDLRQVGLVPADHRPKRRRVVWDTPDFDTLRAKRYQPAVLRAVGFADLLILVVSKEKYADESVWRFLGLIEPLSQPLVVCLNKVQEGQGELLENAFRQQWARRFGKRPLRLIVLPDLEDPAGLDGRELHRTVEELSRNLRRQPERVERALRDAFLDRWLEPARRQEEAFSLWKKWLEEAAREAISFYRRNFLDHAHLYDTLQRVMAELLLLLEVPGIARPMFYFRRALTWPFRWFTPSRGTGQAGDSHELTVLRHGGDHLLLSLQKRLLSQTPHPLSAHIFRALGERLKAQQFRLKAQFEQAVARYYEAFQPQVERTAVELYRKLKERPALLNSLRASRTFADAAALAMVIQTSGIGPHDLVIAPAMFAFTSLLAESALGKFLEQQIDQLKERQLEQVDKLFRENLIEPLKSLPKQLNVPLISLERDEPRTETRYGLFLLGR